MQAIRTVVPRWVSALQRAAVLLMSTLVLTQMGLPAAGASEPGDFSKLAARSTPSWVQKGVIYEIYPRQFSAAGDFNGITDQLDRLQKLGVDILWLMPIHPVGKLKSKGTFGSPYAVRDYYAIDPKLGTADDLRRLVGETHRRGMKIIIDIVANHTAWDSVMMNSPDFYVHDSTGKIIPPNPDWTDVARLNYDNPKLRRYMIDMLKHWVREFDLDGFRCDAAGMVPTDFWEQARLELDGTKRGLLMLAEWDSPALLARAFDLDYAWKGYSAMADAIQGRAPASAVREQWQLEHAQYERGALRMRFTDNHDESRAIVRFGEPAALAASALVFTLDGVPLLYNGMEVGDSSESGAPALFEKRPIDWTIAESRPLFPRTYLQLTAMRHAHPALSDGELIWLHNSDEARVLTFSRRDAGEALLIAVNLSSQPFVGVVEAGAGAYTEILPVPDTATSPHVVALPALSLSAWEYRVFRKTP
jgi:cyclomaltodextrinase